MIKKKLEKAILGRIRAYTTKVVNERGKVIVNKKTLEWLLFQLLNKNIDIDKHANDSILNDYRLHIIKPDDIVLDIGAGGGLYSLLASIIVKKVYTIEPVLTPEYIKNNSKIEFLPFAFGKNNEVIKCQYWDKKLFSKAKNLSSILDEIDDKITVVKCDCEGCEWDGLLGCNDFKNVRMIDLEYHLTNSDKPLIELVTLLKSKGFDINLKEVRTIGMLYAQK